MNRVWALLDAMDSVLDITGLAGGDYHCDKCSNRATRHGAPGPVRHPIVAFKLIDRYLWEVERPGAVIVYLLVAEAGGAAIPRYVGVSKASCLRARWTRRPGSEKERFATGQLIHHQPATLRRIEAEAAGPALATGAARLRLYATTVPELVPLVAHGKIHAPHLKRMAAPTDLATQYAFATSLEEDTANLMEALGLQPWNRTRGDAAAPVTAQLGAGVFALPRFRRPAAPV